MFKPDNELGRTIFDDYSDLISKIKSENILNTNEMRDLLSEATTKLFD